MLLYSTIALPPPTQDMFTMKLHCHRAASRQNDHMERAHIPQRHSQTHPVTPGDAHNSQTHPVTPGDAQHSQTHPVTPGDAQHRKTNSTQSIHRSKFRFRHCGRRISIKTNMNNLDYANTFLIMKQIATILNCRRFPWEIF